MILDRFRTRSVDPALQHLYVKDGVNLEHLHRELVEALPLIIDCFGREGLRCTITSGGDGQHMEGSKHYLRPIQALDFRTWQDATSGRQLSDGRKRKLARAIQRAVGTSFDVVVEKTHIHLEFDPDLTT